ncbi:FG-GAP-like repeat-containing protein [Hyphococcus flavus]|uniref:FG-GAP-like repeat-containing protein n=1 Tax=Hyphococcus flavus TaxID=1866326 RepID=A0AAE9ZH29_9PROT|nr:FG-GAP-like repeat-containing protein [Hyphococcus flavus]WDI30711.1 FG-GAP-like repeat-containing protein [Hyphococcus flavus]
MRAFSFRNSGHFAGARKRLFAQRMRRCGLIASLFSFLGMAAPAAAQQSYLFPGKSADLPSNAYWVVREFSEGENVLDLNIIQWKDGKWSDCKNGAAGSCGTPQNDLMYNVPLYAPADGEIAGCWRNFPDNPNPPDRRNDVVGVDSNVPKKIYRGGNAVNIITENGVIISLAHMAPGTIPPELCPLNAGSTVFPASVSKDGTDWYTTGYIPPGARPKVKKGDFVGRAGNSGFSSGVHLHIGLNPVLGMQGGRENFGPNMPIPFERVYTQSYNPNAGPVTNLWSAADTTINASTDGVTLFRPSGKFADDIVWQRSNGQIHYWAMEDGQFSAGFNIDQPVSQTWKPVGAGNVDGADHDDIIFMAGNGQMHYWKIKNGQRVGAANISTPLAEGWKFGGVGDVDGDNTDDLIFALNGQVHYWKMKNGQRVSGANISSPVSAGWRIGGVGDVDGDGTDDIVWRHANGQAHYWKMKNGKRVSAANIDEPVGSNWSMRDIGDVDHDGTDDIVWQRNDGQVHYWRMKNGKRISAANIHTPVGGEWTLFGVGNVGTRP